MKKLLFLLLISVSALAQKPMPQSQVINLPQNLALINSRLAGHDAQLLTLLPTSLFSSYTATVAASLGGKVDATAFNSYTLSVANSLTQNAANLTNYIASNNAALATKIPNTRIITINGVSQDMSSDRTFNVTGGSSYTLPAATATTLGGIKAGAGVGIAADGTLSVTATAASYPTGDYSQLGSIISDGGGYYNNDGTYAPSGVFDGNTSTFYNTASGSTANVYVGRNLGTSKWVNQVTLLPRQDASYATRINGAVVQSSVDGATWTTQYTVSGVSSGNYTQTITASFAYVQAQYWRLYWAASGSEGNVAEMTIGSVSASSGSSGSSGTASFPAQLGTPVTTMTAAGIQAAINNATPGTTLVLSGTYDCGSTIIEIAGKNGLVLRSHNKAILDGGTTNHLLIKVYNSSNITIDGIKFQSQDTGGNYALLLLNEQGSITNLTVQNCEFTGPNGTFNAISGNAWSNTVNSVYFDGLTFRHNFVHDMGRMGFEILAHSWDNVVHIKHVQVINNTFYNLGLNDVNGMANSVSGEIQYVRVSGNVADQFKNVGLEFIGTIDFTAADNLLTTNKTFNGTASSGYSFTDGGNSDSGNPGHGARRGSVTGGTINVNGRPYQFYYTYDINISGGYQTGTYILAQHSLRLNFTGLEMESLFQSNLEFDGSSNCFVSGCRFSTLNAPGGKYEQIGFNNSSAGNVVVGGYLTGHSDNGSNIIQQSGSSGNKWVNVWNADTAQFLSN